MQGRLEEAWAVAEAAKGLRCAMEGGPPSCKVGEFWIPQKTEELGINSMVVDLRMFEDVGRKWCNVYRFVSGCFSKEVEQCGQDMMRPCLTKC